MRDAPSPMLAALDTARQFGALRACTLHAVCHQSGSLHTAPRPYGEGRRCRAMRSLAAHQTLWQAALVSAVPHGLICSFDAQADLRR